jgi:ABC-type lipopolysaccharide export system ATPase subunit
MEPIATAGCDTFNQTTFAVPGRQVLQLEDVRRQVVGDSGTRGISGGQRKRVNLGLELVAAPALLLLGAHGYFVGVVGTEWFTA